MEGLIAAIPFGMLLAALGFFVYWTNGFFIIYHLTRFGIGTYPKIIALVFFVGSVVLFSMVVALYATIDVGDLFQRFNAEFIFDIPSINR